MKPTLYHYTCDHGAKGIAATGKVIPGFMLTENRLPWTGRVAWFTDLSSPHRQALGLTSEILTCDRTGHRFRVTDDTEAMPYWVFARLLTRAEREFVEAAPGARPAHWWVSVCGVPALLDAARVPAAVT